MIESNVVPFGQNAEFLKKRAMRVAAASPADALTLLTRAQALAPDDPSIPQARAEILHAFRRNRQAVAALAYAMTIPGADAECLYLLGACLTELGYPKPALTAYAAYLHESPEGENRDAALGGVAALRGGARETRRQNRAGCLAERALTARDQGRYERALHIVGQSLLLEPNQDDLRALRAELLVAARRRPAGLREAVKSARGALLLARFGRPALAEGALEGDALSDIDRARLLVLLGRYPEAQDALRGPLLRAPRRPEYMHLSAVCRLRTQGAESAASVWREMVSLDADDPLPRYCLTCLMRGEETKIPRRYALPRALTGVYERYLTASDLPETQAVSVAFDGKIASDSTESQTASGGESASGLTETHTAPDGKKTPDLTESQTASGLTESQTKPDGEPDVNSLESRTARDALAWGLRRDRFAGIAAERALSHPDGERILRAALADPAAPAFARYCASEALGRSGAKRPFAGLSCEKFWIGPCEEPEEMRLSGANFKLLRMATEISPAPLAEPLFQAWTCLTQSRCARRVARDVSGWACSLARAAKTLAGSDCELQVLENRASTARMTTILYLTRKQTDKPRSEHT